MNFSDILNNYISILNCSAKELSECSSISSAVISRFRNNDRTPNNNSEQLKKLAIGISKLANERGLSNITYQNVLSNFNNTLKDNINVNNLSIHFDQIISILNINLSKLARYLNFDASYLSRIRNNQRQPAKPENFVDSICEYIIKHYNNESEKNTICNLINCNIEDISIPSNYLLKLQNWFFSPLNENNYVDDFLKKLNDFNLDEYICSINFNNLKVPTVPFQFPNSKNYFGIEEMKKGELDFFKATILSKSNNPVFMCSDMPMEDMAKDTEFSKKWMYAIAIMLKKGLHLDIIHNIDRPFKEMMLGLESWIPIYMTGQISPYYFKNVNNDIYCNLNYVSNNFVLIGECISGFHSDGKYYLTNNKEEVSFYKKKTSHLLNKAKPLMKIYRKDSINLFNAFINSNSLLDGNRKRILSSLPIFTMSEELLSDILNHNSVSDIDKNRILKFVEQEKQLITNITKNNLLTDEFSILSKEEFMESIPLLSLSGIFYEKKIEYTYDEYLKHIELTKQYLLNNSNYNIRTDNKTIFKNIQIFIHEDNWVMISKDNTPAIHFVIHHPKLRNAIKNLIESN